MIPTDDLPTPQHEEDFALHEDLFRLSPLDFRGRKEIIYSCPEGVTPKLMDEDPKFKRMIQELAICYPFLLKSDLNRCFPYYFQATDHTEQEYIRLGTYEQRLDFCKHLHEVYKYMEPYVDILKDDYCRLAIFGGALKSHMGLIFLLNAINEFYLKSCSALFDDTEDTQASDKNQKDELRQEAVYNVLEFLVNHKTQMVTREGTKYSISEEYKVSQVAYFINGAIKQNTPWYLFGKELGKDGLRQSANQVTTDKTSKTYQKRYAFVDEMIKEYLDKDQSYPYFE